MFGYYFKPRYTLLFHLTHCRYWQKASVNPSLLLQTKSLAQLKLVMLEMGMVTALSGFILLERSDSSMRDGHVFVSSSTMMN